MRRSKRVDAFIDAAARRVRPPRFPVAEEDAAVLSAAVELAASRKTDVVPDPAFVTRLDARLHHEALANDSFAARYFTRRRVLGAAGFAVAAGALGAVSDRLITSPNTSASSDLNPNGGIWTAVAHVDELQPGHIKRFETTTVVGYLYNDQGRISAVSGACTHLGCLLLPAKGGTNLECPCHRATFAPDGKVLSHELMINLPPLPAIASRLTGDSIEVLVPEATA